MGGDPATYGNLWAQIYDEEHDHLDPTMAAEFLSELVLGGRVLELGIGTGRIALPLLERGIDVAGIDSSVAMVEKLRAKPHGSEIEVIVGDMATTELGGPYQLVFIAFNTLFGLVDQAMQVRCFRNVAQSLDVDGRFVIECFVPDLRRFRDGNQNVRVISVSSSDLLRLNVSMHDPAEQRVDTDVVRIRDGEVTVFPVAIRYAWPAELDLMAELAGLELEHRFAGWDREPFTATSSSHVCVYRPRT